MIRVQPAPEPADFQAVVRGPGEAFLTSKGIGKSDIVPEKFPWESGSFWRGSFPELFTAYNGICAYLGLRFYQNQMGTDHFLPKKKHPWQAYEWSNFRLSFRAFNTSKGWSKPFSDPFTIENDWFDLDLWTGRVVLTNATKSLSIETLTCLQNTLEKLNEQDYLLMRLEFIDGWMEGKISLEWVERWAPFVHQVIIRSNIAPN